MQKTVMSVFVKGKFSKSIIKYLLSEGTRMHHFSLNFTKKTPTLAGFSDLESLNTFTHAGGIDSQLIDYPFV